MRRLREQADVTAAALARDVGIDPSQISRIERGARPASDRLVEYYAKRFGSSDLLYAYLDIARGAGKERTQRRDADLIARADRYPLSGDESTFVNEEPPDGIVLPMGHRFTKRWTIRNSGVVPWIGRRLRRIGPATGPWIITSPHHTPIPDTEPGQAATISIELVTPHVQAATVAQWKMVDAEDVLCFPTTNSVGLGVFALVGYE